MKILKKEKRILKVHYKLLEPTNEFSKVEWHKIQYMDISCIPIY